MQNQTEETVNRHICDDGNSSTSCWPKCCGANDVFDVERGRCQSANRSYEIFSDVDVVSLDEVNGTFSLNNWTNGRFSGQGEFFAIFLSIRFSSDRHS